MTRSRSRSNDICHGCESSAEFYGAHLNKHGDYCRSCYFAPYSRKLTNRYTKPSRSKSNSNESFEPCPGCESGVDFDGAHLDDEGDYYKGCYMNK